MDNARNHQARSEPTAADSGDHDEWLIDEALDESFPASDPAVHTRPGSTLAVRYTSDRRTRR